MRRTVVGALLAALVLAAGCGSTEPSAETAAPTFEWSSSEVPFALHWVVPAGEGFVALHAPALMEASAEDQAEWRVVTSSDGAHWAVVEDAPVGELVLWRDGGAWGAAASVESVDEPGPSDVLVTWDGEEFVRSSLPGGRPEGLAVQDLAVGEPGVVVVAAPMGPSEDGAVLFSEDGTTWQRVDPGVDPSDVMEVVASGDGFVLLTMEEGEQALGGSSFSTDGRSWQAGLLDGESSQLGQGTAAGWADGFYLVRGDPRAHEVWQSSDGATWTSGDPEPFAGLSLTGVQGSDLGLLVVAMRDEEGREPDMLLLHSEDGASWETWSVEEMLGQRWFNPEGVALAGDRIVIAQQDMPSEGETRPAATSTVWLGLPATG